MNTDFNYKNIIDIIPYPIAIIDKNSIILYMNECFTKNYSTYKNRNIIKFTDLFSNNESLRILHFITSLFESDSTSAHGIFDFLTAENRTTNLSIMLTIIPDSKYAILSISSSINRQIKSDVLEKRATLGAFSSVISHEFNNLLAGIRGYAQLAKRDLSDFQLVEKAFSIIEKETVRGADLCENLNVYSGNRKFTSSLCQIEEILNHCIDIQKSNFKQYSIKVKTDYHEVPNIKIDKIYMVQVFTNLLNNARNSIIPNGSGEITIRINQNKTEIIVEIEDSGIGINEKDFKNIFDPFYTSEMISLNTSTNFQQGIGIGLTVSQSIVQKHGGSIKVSSTQGKGTVFTVVLPKASILDEDVINENQQTIEKKPVRALVVDDEMSIREVIYRYLTTLEIATDIARNIDELKSFVESNHYDIIFLDYVLPEMNADRVLPDIRQKNPGARIVIISGWSGSPLKKGIIEKQVDNWIEKPFNMERIEEEIRSIIEKHR